MRPLIGTRRYVAARHRQRTSSPATTTSTSTSTSSPSAAASIWTDNAHGGSNNDSMTKLFVTGASGYIGGDALYAILQAHPEYDVTALERDTERGAKVAQQYARVKLVYGDLDDSALVEREASKADIVCHFANADHEASARAIVRGLAARDDTTNSGFYIHTGGTGILMWEDLRDKTFGTGFREKVYDDLEGIQDVTSLPDSAPHRNVDKAVLEASVQTENRVKTALVCPPAIYGLGRGPDNQRSSQLPELCRTSIEKGQVPRVNEGKTYWGNVHIHDLSALYVKLVEEAAAGGSTSEWPDKPATWGAEGYYFCENGEHAWGDVSQWVADEAKRQGFLESNEVVSISAQEAGERARKGQALWGANSRARARRAKAVLGWKPTGPSLKDEIKTTLQSEAKRLGLKPGHAAIAAGNA